ncbi:MAG TPA: hypothetical protein VH008_12360 [Pseudonocardia sp.]|nr:hypothetical protein [Pseudonocardia sp.]
MLKRVSIAAAAAIVALVAFGGVAYADTGATTTSLLGPDYFATIIQQFGYVMSNLGL